jgi:hypothetical protein
LDPSGVLWGPVTDFYEEADEFRGFSERLGIVQGLFVSGEIMLRGFVMFDVLTSCGHINSQLMLLS